MSNLYGATALTGGGTKALDGSTYYDGDDLVDGDGAVVITPSSVYAFHLDAASGAAENSPLVISPDVNAGNKRWLLKEGVFAGLTLYGNIVMPDGGTIGQAAGPLVTFDNTNDRLGIAGCSVNIGTPFFFENPLYELQLAKDVYNTTSTTRLLISGGRKDAGQPVGHFIQSSQIGGVTGSTFAIVEAIGNYTPREAVLGTTRFFIDKDGKIGFGTVEPITILHLEKYNGPGGPILTLRNPTTGLGGGESLGEISFVANDASANGVGEMAKIIGYTQFASGSFGNLGFFTRANAGVALTKQMDILDNGGILMYNLKSGANQGAAGAAADELWVDTADQTIKLGV